MQVYKVELLIIDFDDIGADGVRDELESANYGNDCITPQVMHIETREVDDWHNDHPLNDYDTAGEAYRRLFGV
jgi:hypothetical protein